MSRRRITGLEMDDWEREQCIKRGVIDSNGKILPKRSPWLDDDFEGDYVPPTWREKYGHPLNPLAWLTAFFDLITIDDDPMNLKSEAQKKQERSERTTEAFQRVFKETEKPWMEHDANAAMIKLGRKVD